MKVNPRKFVGQRVWTPSIFIYIYIYRWEIQVERPGLFGVELLVANVSCYSGNTRRRRREWPKARPQRSSVEVWGLAGDSLLRDRLVFFCFWRDLPGWQPQSPLHIGELYEPFFILFPGRYGDVMITRGFEVWTRSVYAMKRSIGIFSLWVSHGIVLGRKYMCLRFC